MIRDRLDDSILGLLGLHAAVSRGATSEVSPFCFDRPVAGHPDSCIFVCIRFQSRRAFRSSDRVCLIREGGQSVHVRSFTSIVERETPRQSLTGCPSWSDWFFRRQTCMRGRGQKHFLEMVKSCVHTSWFGETFIYRTKDSLFQDNSDWILLDLTGCHDGKP